MDKKQNKIMNQRNQGITLIALVVTIVILIILAAVSINMLIGENGIITQAGMAKDEQRGASVEELVGMWKSEKEMVSLSGIGNTQGRDDLLDNELGPNGTRKLMTKEEVEEVKTTGKVQIGSKVIDFGSNARTLVELYDAGELKIGDYVNYQNPSSGSYIAKADSTGHTSDQNFQVDSNMHWRVLGKDKETGGIKLIAGSSMKEVQVATTNNPYFTLKGAKGYINAETELNKIASIYKNNELVEKARSVTIEDINEVTGVTIAEDGTPSLDESGEYGQTYSYTDQYASPEDYLAGKKSNFSKSSNFYGYMANNANVTTAKDTRLYNLLFDNVEYGSGKAYWLASRCVDAHSFYAGFGVSCVGSDGGSTYVGGNDLFGSDGDEYGVELAVRPVISLKSSITEEQIQKIEDQAEANWSYNK